MLRLKPGRASLHASMMVAWIAVLTALTTPDALSQVQYCETVSTGLAEPVDFTAPATNGGTVRVQCVLRQPGGDGKSAALIFLHGQGGINFPRCFRGVTDLFTDWGYVALVVDSVSQTYPSGVQVREYTTTEQANHARGAMAFLASLARVDTDRIGIVGWSTGGLSAIKTIAGPAPQGSGDLQIRAAAVIYPICPANIRRLHAPLLVLIGDNDAVVSVPACRDFNAAVVTGNMQLVIYPNAGHGFDAPSFPTYRRSESKDSVERLRRHFEANLRTE